MIRSKKLKSLGVVEQDLNEEDLLFINSLTTGDIIWMGHKCGFLFTEDTESSSIKRMKVLELQCCISPKEFNMPTYAI